MFIESHPENQFTSSFPLQPFMDQGTSLSYDDPRRWAYTTIGDMAKDTRALKYMYAPPASPDVFSTPTALERHADIPKAMGGRSITLPAESSSALAALNLKESMITRKNRTKVPYIVFPDVGCTIASYRIDVFTKSATSLTLDPVGNPDFIGQITRLGMGPGPAGRGLRNSRRCRKPTATRVLKAEKQVDKLDSSQSAKDMLRLIVTELPINKQVGPDKYGKLSGFEPIVVWLDE